MKLQCHYPKFGILVPYEEANMKTRVQLSSNIFTQQVQDSGLDPQRRRGEEKQRKGEREEEKGNEERGGQQRQVGGEEKEEKEEKENISFTNHKHQSLASQKVCVCAHARAHHNHGSLLPCQAESGLARRNRTARPRGSPLTNHLPRF